MAAPDWFARRWLHCTLRPRYLGIYQHTPNDERRERRPRRDHWEVYVVLAGRITVRWYDHAHVAEAGDAYLTSPGIGWYDDLGRAKEDWRLFNCGFDFVEAGWPNPLRDLGLPLVLHYAEAQEATRRCEELATQWHATGPGLADQVAMRAALDTFLVAVIERGFAQHVFPGGEGIAPAWLQAARGTLLRELTNPDLDMHRLVAQCGYSASHLAHAFCRYYRMAPMRYLRHERMDLAARLLRGHRESTVHAVARRCGYRDANLFARHFRQRFGCSPTRWRVTAATAPGAET